MGISRAVAGPAGKGIFARIATAAVAAFLLATPCLAAPTIAQGSVASARLAFAIRIPGVLRLTTVGSAATVVVPEGAADGVDVRDAAIFDVQSNMRSAYELRFEVTDPEVESVEVIGLGQPVKVSRSGSSLRLWPAASGDRTRRHTLRYVIRYSPGVRPGPRPVPLAYSLSTGA
jgi:hypothetical protein